MTARYATTCRVCSGPVRPGDEITKADQGWAHEPCAATGSDAPVSRARKEMPAVDGALEVWTDGACSGNPGPGGWAWATRDGRQDSGGEPGTTNQRMEIRAALEAVRALDGVTRLVLSTQAQSPAAHRIYARLGFVRTPERDWAPVPTVPLLTYALELYAPEQ